MKKYIRAAEQPTAEDRFNDELSKCRDSAAYAFDGLEKLVADGHISDASEIISKLTENVESAIAEIANVIIE